MDEIIRKQVKQTNVTFLCESQFSPENQQNINDKIRTQAKIEKKVIESKTVSYKYN